MTRNKSSKTLYHNSTKHWSVRADGGPTYEADFECEYEGHVSKWHIKRSRKEKRVHLGVFDLGDLPTLAPLG